MGVEQMNETIQAAMMSIMLIVGVSTLGAILITVFVVRYVRRMAGADLRQSGVAAQATILRMWDTGTTVNDHPVAGVELEVRPSGGAAYRVQTKTMIPRLAIGQVQPGSVVGVKIDPRNNQRVALDLFGA